MKLPSYPKKGRSLALDFRQLLDYVRSNTIVGVIGGKLKRTPNGTIIEVNRSGERRAASKPITPPFWAFTFFDAQEELRVRFHLGYVREQQQTSNDIIKEHEPEIGGVKISDDSGGQFPSLPVTTSSKFYVRVTTDNRGAIDAAPTIVDEADPTQQHHIPPYPNNSGTDGIYYFLIAEFEPNDDTLPEAEQTPILKRRITGHIWLPNQLVQNETITSLTGDPGASVYKEFDEANGIHKWRAVRGVYGVEITVNGDLLDWDFEGENVGTGCNVLVAPEDPATGPAQFRSIKGRGSSPSEREIQVDCTEVDGVKPPEITIQGNGYNQSVSGRQIDATIVDGLVKAISASGDDGIWADVTWQYDTGSGFAFFTMTFEAGVLTGITTSTSPGLPVDSGTGTEADPRQVALHW